VGKIIRRAAAKIMLARIEDQVTARLLPRQLGVGVRGGLDAAVHALRHVHDNPGNGDVSLLQVDLSNAFNNIYREKMLEEIERVTPAASRFAHLAYGQHSNLYIDGAGTIPSACGVQQGDPMAPAFFALGLQPVDDAIQAESGVPITKNYADDMNYAGPPTCLQVVFEVLEREGRPRGLFLNRSKTKNIPIRGAPQMIGPLEPQLSSNFTVLGSPVGDANFTLEQVRRVFRRALGVLTTLPKLGHGQTAVLLLRSSVSICRCVQVMRTVPPDLYKQAATEFDAQQRECLERILHTSLSSAAWKQAQLGVGFGGLGLRSVEAHAESAFVGCLESNQWVSEQVKGDLFRQAGLTYDGAALNQSKRSAALDKALLEELMDASSPIDRRRLVAVGRKRASAWLLAAPRRILGCELSEQQFWVAILRRLGEPLTHTEEKHRRCGKCDKQMSPRATHATRCLRCGDITRRHHGMRDLLHKFGSLACMAPVLEKKGLLVDYPGQRPADVYFPNVYNGRGVAADVAVTDPLRDVYAHLAAEDSPADAYATDQKHAKYDAGFMGSDDIFCPVVFETFGGLSSEGAALLKTVIARAASRVAPHCVGLFKALCWQRVSCCLQRAVAKAILSRLPKCYEEMTGAYDRVAY
jgi:hypothetical protein